MVGHWEDAGEEFYEQIFEEFERHPKWSYDHWIPEENAATYSAAAPDIPEDLLNIFTYDPANPTIMNERLEYSFRHEDTNAVLNVGIPDLTRNPALAVAGAMAQGQTLAEDRAEDSLVSSLKTAQGAVSRRAVPEEQGYVDPVEDVRKVAKIELPFNYDQEEFEGAVDTLSVVAENVGEMHSEVFDVLDGYRGV